jgi:hypothetical protein
LGVFINTSFINIVYFLSEQACVRHMFEHPALVDNVDELSFMNISDYCGFYPFQKDSKNNPIPKC